jgi:hypothetical protein
MLSEAVMRRRIHPAAVVVASAVLAVLVPGCLDRPVSSQSPTVQTNFTAVVDNVTVDKIDILFVIDNSASMGDKQQYLAQAVPNLITRLVTPNCVDPTGTIIYGPSDSMGLGTCTQGKVEFPPVHDMHIGVLSTSLGSRLSDQYSGGGGIICNPTASVGMVNGVTLSNNNDDRAELLNRSGANETPLADAGTSNYLNWFPSTNPKNAGKTASPGAPPLSDPTQLITDFTSLIQGVGNYGCGIESQLESWYRFLVQPDPYASLSLDSSNHAQWVGVDTTILQQRANFLRPDSLVAIIDMTDENDSEIDLRSFGGQGWLWMAQNFDPPRGLSSCAENSSDNGLVNQMMCNSCGLVSGSGSDPSCAMGDYSSENDWGYNANLRHVHMEQKYGIWPQFPIQRYVLGLTSKTVPDRNGEYPSGAGSYQGLTNRDCVNPLFAANLPDGSSTDPGTLCNLTAGTRTPDLIYYAHIGGVPFQLLQQDPTNPNSPPKETLAASDWTAILGNNPLQFDYTGIDPHMIESYQPRAGIPTPSSSGPPTPLDPDNGYDWITDQGTQHVLDVDREYACTFTLTTPRDCTNTSDPSVAYACDCPASVGLTPQQIPPICNPATPTQQVAAKAYPTQRELLLANLMGSQGFVSSLCPIHVSPASGETATTDPLYGYNPAVNGIVERLKASLTNTCLPQQLVPDSSGNVPCLILVQLPTQVGPGACANPGTACANSLGLLGPGDVAQGATQATLPLNASGGSDILTKFCAEQEATYTGMPGAIGDPDTYPTCALQQLTTGANAADFQNGSCAMSPQPGWCYVTGPAANGCPQAILFTNNEPPQGAITNLQCIEQSVTVIDGGTATEVDGGGG